MPQVVSVYAIPAAGAAPVVIRCTRVTSRMEIVETVAAGLGAQGLDYSLLTPTQFGNFTVGPVVTAAPFDEILIAGYPGDHPPNTVPIGNGGSGSQPVSPGGPQTLGTPVVQLTSATAVATSVACTEWY